MKINLKNAMKLYEKGVTYSNLRDEMNRAAKQDKQYLDFVKQLEAVEKNARSRCVKTFDVLYDLRKVETAYSLTKKSMEGTTVTLNQAAQSFPKAYDKKAHGTRPQATYIRATYHAGGWIITDIWRGDCGADMYSISWSSEAKQAMLEKAVTLSL